MQGKRVLDNKVPHRFCKHKKYEALEINAYDVIFLTANILQEFFSLQYDGANDVYF